MRILLLLLLFGCAADQASKTPAAPPAPIDVQQAVRSRIEQYRQGYEVRSIEALEPIYARNDELVVTHQGRTFTGWQAVQVFVLEWFGAAQSCRLRVSDITIRSLGDSGALASMVVQRVYGDGVQSVDEKGTLTLVFRRVGDDWLIVAEHYSYAPPATP